MSNSGVPHPLIRLVHRLEDALLVLLLAVMILLSVTQIGLRNFFDEGIAWADPVLRHTVLWLGLLGAVVATRGNRHISIDVLSKVLKPRARTLAQIAIAVFAAGVSALVCYHGTRLVVMDYESGTQILAGFPAWAAELVIPWSFGVICLRFAWLAVTELRGWPDGREAGS